jgi:Common central domain of tyrosinase
MAVSLTGDLSPSDRTDLVNLILQYINDDIVNEHASLDPDGPEHRGDGTFFPWHQAYIQPLDSYISSQSNGRFDGLPYHDISQPIPDEFLGVVKPHKDGSPRDTTMNPGPFFDSIPSEYTAPRICDFGTLQSMGSAFYGSIHSVFHNDVGGVMATLESPSAAIFWPWHRWVEQVYLDWQTCNK